jgi:hypothetical protein
MNTYYRFKKLLCVTLFFIGTLLLIINILGIIINPYDVKKYQRFARINDTFVSYNYALKSIIKLKYEHEQLMKSLSIEEEILLFNYIVNLVFARISNLEGIKYCGENLYAISFYDNWILALKTQIIYPDYRYEFADPYRTLKTGAGFCSQQSMAVVEILRELGYKAGIVDLNGHAVSWVKGKKGIYILDPDYGVILPFDLEYACSHKDDLLKYYKNMKQNFSTKNRINEANKIADIYYANKGRKFEYKEGVDGFYGPGYKAWEDLLYRLKWIIPITIISICCIFYFGKVLQK